MQCLGSEDESSELVHTIKGSSRPQSQDNFHHKRVPWLDLRGGESWNAQLPQLRKPKPREKNQVSSLFSGARCTKCQLQVELSCGKRCDPPKKATSRQVSGDKDSDIRRAPSRAWAMSTNSRGTAANGVGESGPPATRTRHGRTAKVLTTPTDCILCVSPHRARSKRCRLKGADGHPMLPFLDLGASRNVALLRYSPQACRRTGCPWRDPFSHVRLFAANGVW